MKKLSKLPGVVRTSDCAIAEGANGMEGASVCASARRSVSAAAPANPATAGSRQRRRSTAGAPSVVVDGRSSVFTGRILQHHLPRRSPFWPGRYEKEGGLERGWMAPGARRPYPPGEALGCTGGI